MMSHQHEKEAVCNSVGLMSLVFGVVEVFIGLSLALEASQHCDLDRPVYIRLVLHTAARGHEGDNNGREVHVVPGPNVALERVWHALSSVLLHEVD